MLLPRRARALSHDAALPKLNDRYALSEAALPISPFCVGIVGDAAVIPAAFDAGINFFFLTADMHWPLYENTRRGLELLFSRGGEVREDVVVAVVSYVTQPEFCFLPFEETVKAVQGLGRVDVSVMGGVYPNEFLARLDAYRSHRSHQYLGIRATGATFHDRATVVTAVNHSLVDIALVRYNPGHAGAGSDVFPHIRDSSETLLYNFKSTDGYRSQSELRTLGLAPNDWRPDMTDYYRFALTSREVDGILCALGSESHVAELVDALAKGPLDTEEIQYLRDLAELAAGHASLER